MKLQEFFLNTRSVIFGANFDKEFILMWPPVRYIPFVESKLLLQHEFFHIRPIVLD
jgi:hypothetical protein